jgi:trehalose 6-phosphate phosphatase
MSEAARRMETDMAGNPTGIPGFWTAVGAARDRCLVLDYDGTLAPFTPDRMRAFPTPGVRELLLRIRDSGATFLAIMTGRPLGELLALLGDLDIPLSGSQGTELRFPDGAARTHLPSSVQEKRLRLGQEEALALAPRDRVERKVASVAVHTRGLPDAEAKSLEDAVYDTWSSDADANDLECRRFSGGVELRLKGVNKGTALLELLARNGSSPFCVYVGDDETDEDAFRTVSDGGYGIRVGTDDRPTAAAGRLDGPKAVKEFLKEWIAKTTEE